MSQAQRDQHLKSFAPAKINLTLHVRKRREDGYHDLESLVVFASIGDELHFSSGEEIALTVDGIQAHALTGKDNLIYKATRALQERKEGIRVGAFHLIKHLPISSGIGGGSADAAAALRMLATVNGLALTDPVVVDTAKAVGADVLVCLDSQARMMRGIGDTLGSTFDLPPLYAVLVNPYIAVSTPAVFQALGLAKGQEGPSPFHSDIGGVLDFGQLLAVIKENKNDLEGSAISLCPEIKQALQVLQEQEECLLARMSGSGATTFGLFANFIEAQVAANVITEKHPNWWVKPVRFQ